MLAVHGEQIKITSPGQLNVASWRNWRLVYLCRVELKVCVQIISLPWNIREETTGKKTCVNVLNGTNDLGKERRV